MTIVAADDRTGLTDDQGVMATLSSKGDTKVIWDRTKPAEVEAARTTFDTLKAKGYAAYAVKRDGEKGALIREFDADAQSIILVPQVRGGC